MAVVDTLIACYEEKKFWSFWRPVTAIPLADTAAVDGERLGAVVARDVLGHEFSRRR